MLLEFFFVEMMVTDWEGEHILNNPWISINNFALLISSLVAVKHSIDFLAINSGHKKLTDKMRSIGRETMYGNVDGHMYFTPKKDKYIYENCGPSCNRVTKFRFKNVVMLLIEVILGRQK